MKARLINCAGAAAELDRHMEELLQTSRSSAAADQQAVS